MGKWTDVKYDDEISRKSRALFKVVEERLRKDHPDNPFSFENFVEALDENDNDIRRWFEYLVKETYKRTNRARTPTPYTFRARSAMSTNEFLQSFASTTGFSDLSNVDQDSDSDQPMYSLATTNDRDRDRLPLSSASSMPASFVERVARRNLRRGNSELLDLSEFSYNSSHVRSQPQAINLPPPSVQSHIYERLRVLRDHDRERERESPHRLIPRFHLHSASSAQSLAAGTASASSDHASSPSFGATGALTSASSQRHEASNTSSTSSSSSPSSPSNANSPSNASNTGNNNTVPIFQQGYLPLPEFQSNRRPPLPASLAPPVVLDRPLSPSTSPTVSRVVVRRSGPDQRTDLRHYMREIDSMYLEHRGSDRFERMLERERDRDREAHFAQLDGFERELDRLAASSASNLQRHRENNIRVSEQEIEEMDRLDRLDRQTRRRRVPTGMPTPPHATGGDDSSTATAESGL